jgi:hypothetical protein
MAVEVWLHSFLNFGTRVRSMFSFTFRPPCPQERTTVPIKYVTVSTAGLGVEFIEKIRLLLPGVDTRTFQPAVYSSHTEYAIPRSIFVLSLG